MIIKDDKEFNVLIIVGNSKDSTKVMKNIYDKVRDIEKDFCCKIINYNVNNYTIKTNTNINVNICTPKEIARGRKFNISFIDKSVFDEELNDNVNFCSDKIILFDGENI